MSTSRFLSPSNFYRPKLLLGAFMATVLTILLAVSLACGNSNNEVRMGT